MVLYSLDKEQYNDMLSNSPRGYKGLYNVHQTFKRYSSENTPIDIIQ